MSEGWLFRLRTSLGAGRSAPAWPESGGASGGDAPVLRRVADPAPAADNDAPEPPDSIPAGESR